MSAAIIRAAVIQDASVLFDLHATLARFERLTAEAAQGGAELVLFPEAFLGGYPQGMTLGAVLGSRTERSRDLYRRCWESSLEIGSPEFDRVAAAAATSRIHLAVGVIERDGGTLCCTALIFGPHGQLLAKHQKLVPTAAERLVWGRGDGSTLPVVQTSVGRLDAVMCWESYMPFLRTSMYAKGIEIYLRLPRTISTPG
ncbi:MAG: nitrilase [Kribbellaceae bacterium]|jgi:predicted amidohydrolase|nr:nitrilase [Kribbellaceae bacterium]